MLDTSSFIGCSNFFLLFYRFSMLFIHYQIHKFYSNPIHGLIPLWACSFLMMFLMQHEIFICSHLLNVQHDIGSWLLLLVEATIILNRLNLGGLLLTVVLLDLCLSSSIKLDKELTRLVKLSIWDGSFSLALLKRGLRPLTHILVYFSWFFIWDHYNSMCVLVDNDDLFIIFC